MPESFENLLSDIAQSASASAKPVGAESARRRGRQRAVRRRAAASLMAVVLVGGAGGIAAAVANHHSGPPAPITNSGTPTPDGSGKPASPSTGPSTPGSPNPSAIGTGVTGDLHTVVPGAWTPASRFPVLTGQWRANTSQPAIYTADRQWFYSCHTDTFAHLGTIGYQEKTYQAAGNSTGYRADQVLFFFPSTAAAQQALGTVQSDYANCPEPPTSIDGAPMTGTVRHTERLDGGYAWLHTFRTVNGLPGTPPDVSSDNHEFFVQRGDVVELVWFGGGTSVDDQRGDLQFLSDMEASLCVYGGTCPAAPHPLTATITAGGSTTVQLGGSALEFTVTVTNTSDDTLRNIAPVVSFGHCSCVNTPVAMMPGGVLQLFDSSTGSWKSVFYDTEGSGMDYVLSGGVLQVPALDLPAGQSVTYRYRLQLNPAASNTNLSGNFHLSNGTASIDVSLVHPAAGSDNAQIGDSPTAKLPVTVIVN